MLIFLFQVDMNAIEALTCCALMPLGYTLSPVTYCNGEVLSTDPELWLVASDAEPLYIS
jgi:hypothetical protein